MPLDAPGWIAGTQLRGQSMLSPGCVAALLIVHGVQEHGGRYTSAMHELAKRDLACFVYDQRGHGHSPGARGDIERFSLLVEDAVKIAKGIRKENPELPLFLWGHSMGSLVVALAAVQIGEELHGIITSGCPLDAYARTLRWSLPLLQLLSRAVPRLHISGIFSASDLSHDTAVQRTYKEDPLVEHSVTLRLMAGIASACNEVRAVAPTLQVPWLAAHGTEDRIAPPSGSLHLVERLGSNDKHLVQYSGSRHEIHNELEPASSQFFDDISRWMLNGNSQKWTAGDP